jgi:hypothetical protein
LAVAAKLTVDHAVALLSLHRVRVDHARVVERHLRRFVPEDPLQIGYRAPVVQKVGAEGVPQLVRMKLDPQLVGKTTEYELLMSDN